MRHEPHLIRGQNLNLLPRSRLEFYGYYWSLLYRELPEKIPAFHKALFWRRPQSVALCIDQGS